MKGESGREKKGEKLQMGTNRETEGRERELKKENRPKIPRRNKPERRSSPEIHCSESLFLLFWVDGRGFVFAAVRLLRTHLPHCE